VGLVISPLILVACSSGPPSMSVPDGEAGAATVEAVPPCPVAPISVTVTVDQWGAVTRQLAGACAEIVTIVEGSSADPHDYEPTPSGSAAVTGADLIVMNGLGYDEWAARLLETAEDKPRVVDGGLVVAAAPGRNPHLWYGPENVTRISDAITTELSRALPGASGYFEGRAERFRSDMRPYLERVGSLRSSVAGETYGATEPVFAPMAEAIGLVDRTPEGYRNASTNEAEPSPAELSSFQAALREKQVRVLIVNTQTQGAVTEQLRATAESAGVPVVEITETIPSGAGSFLAWQQTQLERLASALGAGGPR